MATTSVESLQSELATASIMHELASYRVRRRAETRRRIGRMALLRSGSGALPLEYSAVVTMISIAEGFFAATLRTKVEDAFDATTRLMHDMRRDAAKNMDTSWDGRLSSAKRWFGMDHSAEESVKFMLAFVEARNAVVHGVGALTRRQNADGGVQVTGQLAEVGVVVSGGVVAVDSEAVERCAMSCVRAVRWLDAEDRARTLVPHKP